jgi:hypothetical protein
MTKKQDPKYKVNFSVTELGQRNTDYELEPVFRIPNTNQIIVPHYVRPHEWVGLGGVPYTTDQLMNSRAKPELRCMWRRPWVEDAIFKGRPRSITIGDLEIVLKARL